MSLGIPLEATSDKKKIVERYELHAFSLVKEEALVGRS